MAVVIEDDETYLGDGLYVSRPYGSIKLRAPREFGDHEIFLGPGELAAFLAWLKKTGLAEGVLK